MIIFKFDLNRKKIGEAIIMVLNEMNVLELYRFFSVRDTTLNTIYIMTKFRYFIISHTKTSY